MPPAAAIALVAGLSLLVLLLMAIAILRRPPNGRRDGPDGDSGQDGGGPGPRGRGPDGPRPGGHELEWWPEFERQFAAYVNDRLADRRREDRTHATRGWA
jgi:hypothetical protein